MREVVFLESETPEDLAREIKNKVIENENYKLVEISSIAYDQNKFRWVAFVLVDHK